MITLKIRYSTNSENKSLIKEYQRQYTICYKVIAKYISKGLTNKEIKEKLLSYKNIDLILKNSWFLNCLFFDVKCLKKKNVCFNKSLLQKRIKCLITKEEFNNKKIMELRFPGRTVIGAIHRKNSVIIPYGDTQIKTGDVLITFTMAKDAEGIKEYFKVG